MNYQETVEYLYNQLPAYQRIGKSAYKANLDTTLLLDKYFNHPHRLYKTIHVAGTNGKGSVSHMLASVLQSAGYKTGLYTSPHLTDFRERIRVNGQMIPEDEVVNFVKNHRQIMEEIEPSFFEMTAAMAFDYFARSEVDIAVIEVGMGGRLDSTNIIQPILSVITNIGLDHTEFLGDTIAKVAEEKAGIIKKNVPVVIGEWNEESAPVFERKAEQSNSPLIYADKMLKVDSEAAFNSYQQITISTADPSIFTFETLQLHVDLLGNYQKKNMLTAIAAIEILRDNIQIDVNAIKKGFNNITRLTGLQGRWQIIGQNPLIICDTGHNAHGLKYVAEQLKTLRYTNLYMVIGVVNDKDIDSILPFLPQDAYYFFTKADLPRAMDANLLADKCGKAGLKGEVVTGVAEALQAAKNKASADDIIFVGGSTFVVAEVV